MEKQLTTSYWDVTSVDMYVRDETTGAVADFNNSVENDGDDWFEYEQDENREDGHLCTGASSSTGFQCSKIKCILRRKMTTEDPDDMQFAPTEAAD